MTTIRLLPRLLQPVSQGWAGAGEVTQSAESQTPTLRFERAGGPLVNHGLAVRLAVANGMAATAQPLANQIALDILKAGVAPRCGGCRQRGSRTYGTASNVLAVILLTSTQNRQLHG